MSEIPEPNTVRGRIFARTYVEMPLGVWCGGPSYFKGFLRTIKGLTGRSRNRKGQRQRVV